MSGQSSNINTLRAAFSGGCDEVSREGKDWAELAVLGESSCLEVLGLCQSFGKPQQGLLQW